MTNPFGYLVLDESDQARDYRRIAKYMYQNLEEHRDAATGEINATGLAEDTAINGFDMPEWLCDENHIVWEVAVDIAILQNDKEA